MQSTIRLPRFSALGAQFGQNRTMTTIDHRPRVAAERRQRMRTRLFESALLLAASKGPQAVSIDDVISAAEVSRGTFYKYFDAPQSLLQELAAEISQALIQTVDPLVQPIDDVAARLAIGVRTALRLVRAHPVLGDFMMRAGWPAMDRRHLFFVNVGEDITKGIRQGRFARMHVDVGLNLLAGSMVGAMYSMNHSKVPRDFPEQTAAAVLRALGLAAQEVLELTTFPLSMPSIQPDSLLWQLVAQRKV